MQGVGVELFEQLMEKYSRLKEWFSPYSFAVVAFSGGTDSTLVLKAASDALTCQAVLAAIADSPSLARSDLSSALRLAREMDVEALVCPSNELEIKEYAENTGRRCYFCKTEFYAVLRRRLLGEQQKNFSRAVQTISANAVWVDGTNADDLSDDRPGLQAAAEAGIRHPLVECGITKQELREISRGLGLPNWDKPASACLASRLAKGVRVTRENLHLVEKAEETLRQSGFGKLRVRMHELAEGAQVRRLARIEVQAEDFPQILDHEKRCRAVSVLKQLGFGYITFDLEGYRSGGGVQEDK